MLNKQNNITPQLVYMWENSHDFTKIHRPKTKRILLS